MSRLKRPTSLRQDARLRLEDSLRQVTAREELREPTLAALDLIEFGDDRAQVARRAARLLGRAPRLIEQPFRRREEFGERALHRRLDPFEPDVLGAASRLAGATRSVGAAVVVVARTIHGMAHHCRAALRAAQPSAQCVAPAGLPSSTALGVFESHLRVLEELTRNDRRRCPGDLDPLGLVAHLDAPDRATARRIAHLLHHGPPVHRAARVRLVEEDSAYRQRVPGSATEGRHSFGVQPRDDAMARPVGNEVGEDAPHDFGLRLINESSPGGGVVSVAVDTGTRGLR